MKDHTFRLVGDFPLALLFSFVFFALGAGAYSVSAAERFTVANSGLNIYGAVLWLGQDKGFFRKYGLDVEIIYIPSGTQAMQALLSGDVKAAIAAGSAATSAKLRGAPVKIIAGVANYYPLSFFSTPDIKHPRDLRGKKVAVTRFGSSSHFVTVVVLREFGLEEGKDYTILQLGTTQNRFIALTKGMIQGTTLPAPESAVARNAGMNVLISMSDMKKTGITFLHNGLIVSELALRDSRPLVRAFLKAYLEGVREVYRNKEASMQVLGRYTRISDRKVLSAAYDETYESVDKEGAIIDKGIEAILGELGKTDPKAFKAKAAQFYDRTLLQELSKEGFIKALWAD